MRRLLAAISFLTRLPVPSAFTVDGRDVGRSTLVFPLVGALVGGLLAMACRALSVGLPPLLCAVLVVAFGAILTGALHLDGLADMADGFGGGRTREDVLRIMRDHAIGAYGAIALILVLLVKVVALATLIETQRAELTVLIAAALGRWAAVPLGRFLPYAREGGGLGASMVVGWLELIGATVLAAALAIGLGGAHGALLFGATAGLTLFLGLLCRRRIGGMTGDTLGATVESCEALVYVMAVWLR